MNFLHRWTIGRRLALMLGVLLTLTLTVADAVAEGRLDVAVPAGGADETGQLLRSLERMRAGLSDIVGAVRDASDSIATGATQIAQGNADLSQRTEQQAANLQQTAASMEQLGSTVAHNVQTTERAAALATGAEQAARSRPTSWR